MENALPLQKKKKRRVKLKTYRCKTNGLNIVHNIHILKIYKKNIINNDTFMD